MGGLAKLIVPDIENLEESLAIAKEYDLGFEFNDFCLPVDYEDIDRAISKYKSSSLPRVKTLHGAFLDIVVYSADPKIKQLSRERVIESMNYAQIMEVTGVVFHTNFIPTFNLKSYLDYWVDENESFFSQMLEKYPSINIYMENMFDLNPELLSRLASRLSHHKNFGICFDFGHASLSDTPISEWLDKLHPYIKHCHVNDNDRKSDLHAPLGTKALDFHEFFNGLKRYQITPTILLEVRGLENQRLSLEYCEKYGF